MLNQEIMPHPCGTRQQWTISVQHTEEHVHAPIESFKNVAPRLADEQSI